MALEKPGAIRALPRSPDVGPFARMDVAGLLSSRAAASPDRPFLEWAPFEGPVRIWSYREFHREVCAVAAGLSRRGVSAGDRVLLHMDNCPELLIAWHACARIGAVAVTTNTRSSAAEIAFFAAHSQAVAGVTQPRYVELLAGNALGLRWLVCTDMDSIPAGYVRPSSTQSFATLHADPNDAPSLPPDPRRPLSIQFTSGTTSRPKAVLWTHANGLWGARAGAANECLTPDDAHLVILPLFHTNALSYSMLATLWAGARMVLQPRFSASRFWPVAVRHRCTWCSMVGFSARALLEHDVPERHFMRVISPAVALPTLEQRFGVKTMGLWGMTETVTQAIVTDLSAPSVPMSIGRSHPAYEIAVLDDNGDPIRPGGTGSLLIRGIRGVTLFQEYLGDEAATANSFDADGFFITGDRVTLLDNGELRFADRDKDMLKVGGENVAASEVEAVIATVDGVREVAVVGKPDHMLDEVPVAFVVPVPDIGQHAPELAERIRGVCTAQLADFKVPREVRIVPDLPRATLEKVSKVRLKELLRGETK